MNKFNYYQKSFEQRTFVYILECADKSYYIGHTNDIEARMFEHNMIINKDCYTAHRLPVKLIYAKEFSTRDEAFAFERQIKKWSRKKKEALIKADYRALKTLSRRKNKK